jgi:myosin tail region-interacting protein MTI1
MAKLGGIRFGAPPPIGIPPPPKVERETKDEGEEGSKGEEEEEEDEQARRQRIAAKLAGMGGMRIGMVPGAIPPPKPPTPIRKDSASTKQPPPPVRAPPPPTQAPPPPVRSDTGNASEDDVVKVEIEESEAEEVDYHDLSEEVPPPIPSRKARPPIPGPGHFRKRSSGSIPFPTQNTAPSRVVPPAHSEYVMVEEPEELTSSPPSRPPRAAPPPPAPSSDVPDDMTMSQWELPPIPRSSIDTEASAADLSASSWSGTFDGEETPQERPAEFSSKERRQSAGHLTADQLVAIWGRVGVHICEVAIQLFEKSKKALIGDGTHIGFVNEVLEKVPNVSMVEEDASSFGYLIYAQTGSSVTKRAAEIMPGDIIALQDAKLKGHKGIQAYHQTVGAGTPVVAVVCEYEPKKSKVKAYQASQQVGNQVCGTMNPASMVLMFLFRQSSLLVIGWKI